MLAPDVRATLVEQLRPDGGTRLDHLVGTTFTLDLEAALLPALAFAPPAHSSDPLALLASIRACADAIDIFHQCGHIRVPERTNALMAFLEPAVHAVRNRPGALFHPKIWLAKYVDEDAAVTFRLIVQSRNLTRDNSWDMVVVLDGVCGTARNPVNKPLSALLRYLADDAPVTALDGRRRQRLHHLADELRYAQWTTPDGLAELAFHVFGVPGHRAKPDFGGTRHLVISPFLSDDGLATAVPGDRVDATVISRAESLEELAPTTLGRIDHSYVLHSAAGIPDPESDSASVLGGLHAKAYIVEYGHRATLFVGSANATAAAFGKNVEILVELTGSKKSFGIDTLLGPTGMGPMLELFGATGGATPDPADAARRELDKVLREIAATPWTATVAPADDLFDLIVESRHPLPAAPGFTATVELTTRPGNASPLGLGSTVDFRCTGLALTEIMPFLAIRVTSSEGLTGATVVVADLVDAPDERLDEILAAQLETPEDVLRFIALMLAVTNPGGGPGGAFDQLLRRTTGTAGAIHGILESLLLTLAAAPHTLTDMDGFIQRLALDHNRRSLLPPGFVPLWENVHAAATILHERQS